jgi:hypothetical protein
MGTDAIEPRPRPAEFKTQLDGRGGLVRVRLVGEPHDGRELFIDELDLPAEIYTSPRPDAFEWWPARMASAMNDAGIAQDPTGPPVRYVLRVPNDTREPLLVADAEAR